jgi:hypothetical protein
MLSIGHKEIYYNKTDKLPPKSLPKSIYRSYVTRENKRITSKARVAYHNKLLPMSSQRSDLQKIIPAKKDV